MRGYFGIGIYHPKDEQNIGTLWRSAYIFGAQYIFTIGMRYKEQASDTVKAHRHVPLFHYDSLEEFKKASPKNSRLVCIEIDKRAHDLDSNYVHPQQAIYVLGAEDSGIPKKLMNRFEIITIPSMRDFCLNVATAGSIVMYDRFIKGAA